MKRWHAVLIAIIVLSGVVVASNVLFKKDYVALAVPGLNEGEVIQMECVHGFDESQQDFDRRVQDAGTYFRNSLQAALREASEQMADAILNKSGANAANQLNNADQLLNAKLKKTARHLRTLYKCEFISM